MLPLENVWYLEWVLGGHSTTCFIGHSCDHSKASPPSKFNFCSRVLTLRNCGLSFFKSLNVISNLKQHGLTVLMKCHISFSVDQVLDVLSRTPQRCMAS